MFRHYLIAALRRMTSNTVHTAINIIGLSIGFAAAILIALFVHDEFSYDKWIPGHERTFVVRMLVSGVGTPTGWSTTTSDLAEILKDNLPAIEATARLRVDTASLRHGLIEANETIYWADPRFFDVVPLPATGGDLATALQRPDGIVITRRIARKYFGRDNPIGETIELNRKNPMRVMAVLDDLPSNTHLNTEIIASGRAAFSLLAAIDAAPRGIHDKILNVRAVYTYMRLRPGASIADLRRVLPDFIGKHTTTYIKGEKRRIEPVFVPLASVHLNNIGDSPMRPPGDLITIATVTIIGILIIVIATINFVNLMTASVSRRAIEIGMRKASGARRQDIAIQFIGETFIYIAASMVLALAIVELLLPAFSAFLGRSFTLYQGRDVTALAAVLAAAILTGVLAALYPAFVFSSFRPATVFRKETLITGSVAPVREALVLIQFAILIGLMVATSTVYSQAVYALNDGMRLDTDQVLLIQTACRSAFKEELLKLPGVVGAACSSLVPSKHTSFGNISAPGGGAAVATAVDPVDFGFFELYGLKAKAGRFFALSHPADAVMRDRNDTQPPIVINETAARRFGFYPVSKALGKTLAFKRFIPATGELTPSLPAEIIGVAPDFTTASVSEPIMPTIFYVDRDMFTMLSAKLRGRAIPETLRAIDRLWESIGPPRPIIRVFFRDQLQDVYVGVTRATRVLGALAVIAVFIACLGLFGLSSLTTERRIKEIGVRKAMGASSGDIVRMLVWQFSKPVLWANLIAWPVAWWAMSRWLSRFAYHVDLAPWQFLSASGLAFVIALLTVSVQTLLVARQKPVLALRHE